MRGYVPLWSSKMSVDHDVFPSGGEDDDEPDEFYFESDHLALKGNKDYLSLLKTLAILQAQRTRALQDLDTIQHIKERALSDPESFISVLQAGGDLGVPHRQVLAQVPSIEWAEYNTSAPSNLSVRPTTRRNAKSACQTKNATVTKRTEDYRTDEVTVRGRTFNQDKPETFNQLWTAEEQRRLEELLIEFPPEEVESRRFQKIAEALGNRTRMQVSSRVQKYFLKLMKAGLPVPGRAPRLTSDTLKRGSHSRQRANHFLSRPSTFFPQHQDLPVYMPDDSEELQDNAESFLTIKTEATEFSPTVEQRKLQLLQQVRNEKEKGIAHGGSHCGFKCDVCNEEPIVGTRWHCLDCLRVSVDFCTDCLVTQLESVAPHPPDHRFEAISSYTTLCSNNSFDPDYLPQSFSQSYNYLDPNFLPQ